MDQQKHQHFAERLVRNQHRIFGYILALIPNRADADEVFQQTCLLLWENWERFDLSRDFFPWACGFAHNQIRSYFRTKNRSRIQLDADVIESLAEPAIEVHRDNRYTDALRDCLQQLPKRSRDAVEGFYGGKSVALVAREQDSTSNAIYKLLRRVRTILRDCVSDKLASEVLP